MVFSTIHTSIVKKTLFTKPVAPLGNVECGKQVFFSNTSANSAKDHFVYKLKKNLVKLSCE